MEINLSGRSAPAMEPLITEQWREVMAPGLLCAIYRHCDPPSRRITVLICLAPTMGHLTTLPALASSSACVLLTTSSLKIGLPWGMLSPCWPVSVNASLTPSNKASSALGTGSAFPCRAPDLSCTQIRPLSISPFVTQASTWVSSFPQTGAP